MKKIKIIIIISILSILQMKASAEYVFSVKEKGSNLKVQNIIENENIIPSCGESTLVSHEIAISSGFCNTGTVESLMPQKNHTTWNCVGTNKTINCSAKMMYTCNFKVGLTTVRPSVCDGGIYTGKAGVINLIGTCSDDLNPIINHTTIAGTFPRVNVCNN